MMKKVFSLLAIVFLLTIGHSLASARSYVEPKLSAAKPANTTVQNLVVMSDANARNIRFYDHYRRTSAYFAKPYRDAWTTWKTTVPIDSKTFPRVEVHKEPYNNSFLVMLEIYKFRGTISRNERNEILDKLKLDGAYVIFSRKGIIKAFGYSPQSILNAMSTLEVYGMSGSPIQQGYILDWPDHPVRALYRNFREINFENGLYVDKADFINDTKKVIRDARRYHFNELIASIGTDGVQIDAVQQRWLDVENNDAPFIPFDAGKMLSKSEFADILGVARENGLEVKQVHMNLLSHQAKFFKDNCFGFDIPLSLKGVYDPLKVDAWKDPVEGAKTGYEYLIYPVIDEVMDLAGVKTFHMAHDEAILADQSGGKKPCLPAEDFLFDVMKIYDHVKSRGSEYNVAMFGDMLLNCNDPQFAAMKHRCDSMKGNETWPGNTFGELRVLNPPTGIPKDMIIYDWNYYPEVYPAGSTLPNYLDLNAFKDAGFKTIYGYTWQNGADPNFSKIQLMSKYARDLKGISGMVEATYLVSTSEGVPKDITDECLFYGGNYFWNADKTVVMEE